ncbi:hypothetical protein BJV78DRAFT_1281342 [Lactifluus subvellereus]|nr:hypothetical protein BJV78DRAFT_1281342 [Lactifluus subvellereus]
MTSVHRRKSSNEEDENLVIAPNGLLQPDGLPRSPRAEGKGSCNDLPQRDRAVSGPAASLSLPSYPSQPSSPGPFRTGFSFPKANGYAHSASTLRPTFSTPAHLHLPEGAHSRTRSISSGPFTPTSPSPLSVPFPSQDVPSSPPNTALLPSSATLPEFPRGNRTHATRVPTIIQPSLNGSEPSLSPSTLLPHTTIAEDGAQEIAINLQADAPYAAGVPIPSASPTISRPQQRFGEGFTFGARPPSSANGDAPADEQQPLPSASRRGHHHKHSLSHNFFSFLEPGSTRFGDLTSQPTPTPVSPWASISSFPQSAGPSTAAFPRAPSKSSSPVSPLSASDTSPFSHLHDDSLPLGAIAASCGQLALGAWLWITGQGIGSLACTGLGYWVVFDAIGIAVGKILPAYFHRPIPNARARRPYGTRRLETVALFTQVVYLMFSAVYVFKETVEHVLLSAGEGHHHHPGDEDVELLGIDFPIILPILTLLSLLSNSLLFDNHNKLVNVTGNQLPPLSALFDPSRFQYSQHTAEPSSRLDKTMRNPFSLVPIGACTFIVLISVVIPSSSHRTFDLLLAGAEATAMFHLAHSSCKSIGAVLLQTAPARGLSAGRMESFLRAMREIERHPQVRHLPPPHIWQLAPSVGAPQPLVVTLELRVAPDLGDKETLKLTRWAWERCTLALGLAGREQDGGGVTVGIVRG